MIKPARFKGEKITELIKHLSAEFLRNEANRLSMITVTSVSLSDDRKNATIFFTVLPEDKEKDAVEFLRRKRSDFRNYFKAHARIMKIPFFDFEIDLGEKNRQKIDELSSL